MSLGVIASSYTTGGGGGTGSQFASEVLADSPLLYWRIGESSGTTAVDSSGNGRDGTYFGSPTLGVPGMIRGDANTTASFLQSTNDYISLASASWMNVASMTISCSVVFFTTGLRMFVTRYYDPDGDRSWFLYSQNREFKFYVRDGGGGETIVNSGFTAIPGEVYYIAAYSSASESGIRVYDKTGLLASATGLGRAVNSSNRPFMVARSDDGPTYQHEAYIDEVAFYGSVLSPTRLDDLATEFFAPRPWINRTVGIEPRNGTTNHTINFAPAASGSLLVLILNGPVTNTAVSGGWTEQISPVGFTELSVFTKIASASESNFLVSHNASNYPVHYAVYEFPNGCDYHSGVSASNSPWPVLNGLPGSDITVFCVYSSIRENGASAGAAEWYFPMLEEADDNELYSVTQGVYTAIAYKDNYTLTSVPAPTVSITNAYQAEVATFAISMV